MRFVRAALLALALVSAVTAQADAPASSARPEARPLPEAARMLAASRPLARPVMSTGSSGPVATAAAEEVLPAVSAAALPAPADRAVLDLIARTETALATTGAATAGPAVADLPPLGIVAPTGFAVLASARPQPRLASPSVREGAVERVTDLIARGDLQGGADLPLVSFMARPPGIITALAPTAQTEALAAPMGLILATPAAAVLSPRPKARLREDRSFVTRAQYRANLDVFALSPLATPFSLRPLLRPAALTRRAEEARAALLRGSVCGVTEIQGEAIGDVPGPGACGIDNAVRLRSVAGITFSGEAPRVDCDTARALNRWLQRSAIPALASQGGGLSQLSIMGTYSCRNRNGARSGRISEHAFGKAFDIGGFKLRDGTSFTVLRDWGSKTWGQALRRLHDSACGPFGTVLGPNANAAHRNHFHFDTADYRAGSYCR